MTQHICRLSRRRWGYSYLSIFLIPLLVLFFVFIIYIQEGSTIPIVSEASEVKIGKRVDKEILDMYGYYNNPELQTYVNEVGQRLVKSLPDKTFSRYYFKIVDSSIINAFALPGGYVYITRGMLAMLNSEAELAGILGHEIGHITSHHAAKQLSRSLGSLLLALGGIAASQDIRERASEWILLSSAIFNNILLGYGRKAEMQADALGFVNAYNTGYDPRSMVKFLLNLKFKERMEGVGYHGFQATHPETKERIIKAEDIAHSLVNRGGKLEVAADRFKLHLDGLLYGGKKDKKDKEGERAKKRYIRIYTIKKGDTLKSIAEKELGDVTKVLELAMLNGIRENTPLKEGEKLKLIKIR